MNLSSRELFDNLIQERKFKESPLAVRLAMRKWAFSEYGESDRCELTPDEQGLLRENPDFVAYVKQKMDTFTTNQEFPWLSEIFLRNCRDSEEKGERYSRGLPWFLYLSESELAKRREGSKEERRDRTFLTSGISEHPV